MRASSCLLALLATLPTFGFATPDLGKPGTGLILLTEANQLVFLTDSAPTQISPPLSITGIDAADQLVAIDVRPMNQQLYGLGINTTADTVQLYCIAPQTGWATKVGTANGMVTTGGTKIELDALRYGIDFNPSADRLRVVNSSSLNFRINPTTGLCVDTDGNSGNGTNPDGTINGGTTSVDEVAYTNNVPENGNVTTLYALDSATDGLYIQTPPNNGTETLKLSIKVEGIPLLFENVRGFDIPVGVNVAASNTAVTGSGYGYAVLEAGTRRLYRINLATGDATLLSVPAGVSIRSMAVATQVPVAIALDASGNLIRFRRNTPGTTTTVSLIGPLGPNETMVGIDYRPATGQLYGVGISSTDKKGSLYLIDPQLGSFTLAFTGTQGAIAFDDGTGTAVPLPPASDGYGMDFNPTVDRLRVTSGNAGGAGINFRVNPITGQPVDGNNGTGATIVGTNPDGTLNGGTTGATSCAYTNSYGQVLTGGVTTLYVLDPATNSLYIQNPPNNGTLTSGKLVKLNGATLDFTAASGFDITAEGGNVAVSNVASPGEGWAALTVGGVTKLYRINLRTAEAKLAGTIGTGTSVLVGLAVAGEAGPGYAPYTFSSVNGTKYRIDTSTDCVNWQPFTGVNGGTFTATGTTTAVPVPWYESESRRFWRKVVVP